VNREYRNALDQLRKDLESSLSKGRLTHVISTTNTALNLGKEHGADLDILEVSGLLHDVAREMPVAEQESILREKGLLDSISERNPVLFHAKVAAVLGTEKYGFPQNWVEPAKWHTTGKAQMNLEEIILFVSDQIEPERPWSNEALISAAHTNLYESFRKCMLQKLEFTLKRGKMIHPDSIQCWNWLCLGNSWAN